MRQRWNIPPWPIVVLIVYDIVVCLILFVMVDLADFRWVLQRMGW